jgi:putative transposase
MREKYPTDLIDAEWEIAQNYIPHPIYIPNLQIAKYARRDILDAIRYRERTGCQWRNLPHDFPPWNLVFHYYYTWTQKGIIQKFHDALRSQVREQTPHKDGTPRAGEAPKVCMLDSQSAKTTEESNPDTRGYDAGKKIKGRKRHLIVDALGLVLALQVTVASVQDRDAALPLFKEAKKNFPSLVVGFADGGYRGEIKSLVEKETGMKLEITLRSDIKKKI